MSDSMPHIEIMHSFDASVKSNIDLTQLYDCDKGALALPEHIKIGSYTWDKAEKIMSYDQQVDEYNVWLEDQIKKQNIEVMTELEKVFQMALGKGVILTTICMPQPYMTHAHRVRDTILELAAGES